MYCKPLRGLFCLAFAATLFLSACLNQAVYEKHVPMRKARWKASHIPEFKFQIKDTQSGYVLYLMLRHTDAYPYSNIWLKWTLSNEEQTHTDTFRVEVPLATEDGRWLGRGMGEIWEHQMPLNREGRALKFDKPGNYRLRMEQIMRIDPLPEIMSTGIRLEKQSP